MPLLTQFWFFLTFLTLITFKKKHNLVEDLMPFLEFSEMKECHVQKNKLNKNCFFESILGFMSYMTNMTKKTFIYHIHSQKTWWFTLKLAKHQWFRGPRLNYPKFRLSEMIFFPNDFGFSNLDKIKKRIVKCYFMIRLNNS